MEQIAEKITEDLLQKLPDEPQFFTPDELLSSGVPHIVVETLRKNIQSTIESELKIPESEWVQTENDRVQEAWRNFSQTSRRHLQVPASKLSYLLAESVEQCLELALKPRQAVVEIIFRTRETIDFDTVKTRLGSLEVNRQLGLALVRYMEKKEKDEIALKQALELIKKVDERLVENYHPLSWAQALKPVFDLAGPSVDTDLFRIFFEDKSKLGYARKFNLLDGELTETEFIEVLSSADMLDIEAFEDEQPEIFVPLEEEADPEKVVEIEEAADETDVDEKEKITEEDEDNSDEWNEDEREIVSGNSENIDGSDEEEQEPVEPVQPEQKQVVNDEIQGEDDDVKQDIPNEEEMDEQNENIVNLFTQIKNNDDLYSEDHDEPVLSLVEDEDDSNDDKEENITLLSKFIFDESVDETLEEVPEEPQPNEEKEPASIYEEMNLVKDDHSDVREKENFFEESSEENEETEEELSFKIESEEEESGEIENEESVGIEPEKDQTDVDEDDQPMWRSFLERDDIETDSGYEYEEETDEEKSEEFKEEEEDGFIEEPIYDLTTDESEPEEKISKISSWLNDEKKRFVDEIFMGSEIAYEQALKEIIDFENWKAASVYLEQEVFSRNKVDVYDEAAVDFTDRLHSYFLENNSKQDE